MNNQPKMLTTIQGVADFYGVSYAIAKRVVKMGGFPVPYPARMQGTTLWFIASEVRAFLAAHMTKAQVLAATGLAEHRLTAMLRTGNFKRPVFKTKCEGKSLTLWARSSVEAWLDGGAV